MANEPVPYERFQEVVNEKNAALETAKKAEERAAAAEKAVDPLKKQVETLEGKLNTANETHKTELESKAKEWQEKEAGYAKERKQTAVTLEALRQGAKDPEVIARLVDFDKIEVAEDGTVKAESVSTMIGEIKTKSDYLFGTGAPAPKPNAGDAGGGAPEGGGSTTPTFKRSQLQSAKFYAENKEAVDKARAEGKIINDI